MKQTSSWRDEPRHTVQVIHDEARQISFLQGTSSHDADRANLFCVWEAEEDGEEAEEDPLWGPRGRYREATRQDPVRLEVEVRFAFNAVEDASDHAEVYLWQVYRWELVDGRAECRRDENFGGETIVEAGGLQGPFAIYQPVVAAGVERIQSIRWK